MSDVDPSLDFKVHQQVKLNQSYLLENKQDRLVQLKDKHNKILQDLSKTYKMYKLKLHKH